MAKDNFDKEDGVWRTVGGRRIFIRDGQSLSDAMKESGKFKSGKKISKREQLKKDIAHQVTEAEKNGNTAQAEADKRELARLDLEYAKKHSSEEAFNRYEREISRWDPSKNDKLAKLEEDTKDMSSYDKYNLAVSKLEDKENLSSEEKHFWNRAKMDYEREQSSKSDPYDDPESEESQRLQDIQRRYDEYLQDTEGRNTSYGELAHIESLRGKELDDFEKELDEYEAEKYDKEDNDKEAKGKEFRQSLEKLNDKSIEDGTYDLATGKKVDFGNEGYNVSFEQSSDNYSDSEYYDKIEECRKLCDGNVYAGKFGGSPEISFYTKDKETAMKIMEKYNQHSIYDNSIGDIIENAKYNAETNKVDYKEKSTNEIMNEAIKEKASRKSKKFEPDLPKHTEIKSQGTSNRKEVSENIQAHILEHYDSPEDFIEQMDAYDWKPTLWHRGEALAEDGFYDIYYDDQRKFLDDLKINPKGKDFDDDRVFQTYKSLIGRESAKLYDRIKKNQYNEYKRQHPLTTMTFEDFKDMKKGGR